MHPETRKVLTIITEAALEHKLTEDLEKLGATGYTLANVRGRGSRGVRDAGWSTSGNIRIDVVCDTKRADVIAAHVRDHYYADYAMIVYVSDVAVLRPEKF